MYERVEAAAAIEEALASQTWDLVVADHSVLQLDSLAALNLLKASGSDTPFIIVSGTIGDASVDESVTSGPSTFNSVEPLSAIEFPVARPDPAELQQAVQDARSAADAARLFGLIGIAAGVIGILVGAIALARSGRPHAAPPATPIEPAGKLVR